MKTMLITENILTWPNENERVIFLKKGGGLHGEDYVFLDWMRRSGWLKVNDLLHITDCDQWQPIQKWMEAI